MKQPQQSLYEEKLSVSGGYTDLLSVFPDRITIQTLDHKLEVVGEVSVNFATPPNKADINMVKGFYAQGQAMQQRKIGSIIGILFKSVESVVVAGPGDDPSDAGPGTPGEGE